MRDLGLAISLRIVMFSGFYFEIGFGDVAVKGFSVISN
jgi:hypothetical protein